MTCASVRRVKKLPLFFNVAGPCQEGRHYMLPPEPRLPEARELIDEGQYFVVHAPRQTGKTTTLQSLARSLTAEGDYLALWFTCESAGVGSDTYGSADERILAEIKSAAEAAGFPEECLPPDPWPEDVLGQRLRAGLAAWAAKSPKPLVLFFDEIDVLQGDGLVSVLKGLQAGFTSRPRPFPHAVVLCGLRDVRDYKAASGGDPTRLGTSSPFNVKVESLQIGDFTFAEVVELYGRHTTATGQIFATKQYSGHS